MGRWSQARRTGGGAAAGTAMTAVILGNVNELDVLWSNPVTAAQFALADFLTGPNNRVPTTIAQVGVNELLLTFAVDVSGEANLTYMGDVPGVRSPQTRGIEI